MKRSIPAIVLLWAINALAQQQQPAPIIDMHLHALKADANGPPPLALCPGTAFPGRDPAQGWVEIFTARLKNPTCEHPIWGGTTDEEVMTQTLEILERRNITGVTSGSQLDKWRKVGGARIVPALAFGGPPQSWPKPEEFRRRLKEGGYRAFAEVSIQYNGVSPSDPEFEPYLAIAEELDIPMGIHIGTGPPGAPYFPPFKNYRARLHSALVLEEALLRHPKLRVWIMHAGWPMGDDLLAVMWAHPHVYVDVGVIDFALPRAEFHRYLQRIVEAGFGKRVMFGSDQMNWPKAIEYAIESINTAAFLTEEQKRDILYNNAARFLRLNDGATR
jgi:hypothetical protein